MPGIYGCIFKTPVTEGIVERVLTSMSNRLLHHDWYRHSNSISNGSGFGAVSIRGFYPVQTISMDRKSYLVLIDGYVYAIGNKRLNEFDNPGKDVPRRVLSLYLDKGTNALEGIKGNYTIAIYDEYSRELVLFNDRIGPRRLYYADLPEMFVFSPEMKALSLFLDQERDLNWQGIGDFLSYGYILGDKTFFSSVHALPSASILRHTPSEKKTVVSKYWHPRYRDDRTDLDAAVEECLDLLHTSISEKVKGCRSVVCPISGGLDSRIILGTLEGLDEDVLIEPITYGQRFSHEYKNARRVCSALGLRNHSLIEIDPQSLLVHYPQAVWLSEGMVPLTNAHLLLIPENTGCGYDTFLNGIYGGPTNYSAEYFREDHIACNLVHDEKARDIEKVISIGMHYGNGVFHKSIGDMIRESSFRSISDELEKHLAVSEKFCDQRDAFFIENRMRRFICQSSLYRFFWEEQLPLSNYELYSFYLSTAPELKMHRNLLKAMLRKKFPVLASIPDANTGLNLYQHQTSWYRRKKKLARDLKYYISRLSGGKITFYDRSTYAHHAAWFRNHGPTTRFFRDQLFSPSFLEARFVDGKKLHEHFSAVQARGYGVDSLFRIATFSLWYRLFVKGEGVGEMKERSLALTSSSR